MTDPDRPTFLNNLGLDLNCKYVACKDIELLEEAIRIGREAVRLTGRDDPDLPAWLSNLGMYLSILYERTARMDTLNEAIKVTYQAIDILPQGHADLAGMLNNLGTALQNRYDITKMTEDLEEAIRMVRQATTLTPEGSPQYLIVLPHLSDILMKQYDQTENTEDLIEAIQIDRRVVNLTPRDHPKFAQRMHSLALTLSKRYDCKHDLNDLQEAAVRLTTQAVELTEEGSPHKAMFLNSMGLALASKYQVTGDIDLLNQAIEILRKVADLGSKGHPNFIQYISYLNNLAIKLSWRFKYTGEIHDLNEAIRIARRVMSLSSADQPSYGGHLNNLGNYLRHRYESLGEVEDIKEAIQLSRQALDSTNTDGRTILAIYDNLASQLYRQYEHTGTLDFLEEAIQLRRHTIGPDAAKTQLPDSLHSMASYLNSRYMRIGEPTERALEDLERGRGVILGLLMDDRSDISHLEARHPELYAQYEALRSQLSNPPHKNPNEKPSNYLAEKRAQIAVELDKCIEDIQQLPGFQNLFKGLTSEEIKDCAAQGNIIVVNITRLRSDILIVTPNAIEAFPLPDLKPRDAFDWVQKGLTATSMHDRGKKNKEYRDFLAWLWRTCVDPVLDHMGYPVESDTGGLPRVWWIGTGLASSFPFHAANKGSGRLEHSRFRVISSYTTTIKALKHSRERFRERSRKRSRSDVLPPNDQPRLLVIAMPETPGAEDLPGVRAEISEVKVSIGNSTAVEILECSDVASSLKRLEHCNIAHFACHGISDYNDPSQSGLILQEARASTQKPRAEVLSVQRVFQEHFSKPQIAYLSACSTAQNGADRLKDEVLHAVSGFQVAGFKHVLGCMWPSDDSVCVKVARSFYTTIGQSHHLWKDDRAVALAMHNAVLAIQENAEYRKRPLLWAQYVHFGA
ncbi:CHAT domain-containing protein [Xylogone sp. PMI_703]|nr:CHAT domain-containing protein [Xylogone sp. PMI_703]